MSACSKEIPTSSRSVTQRLREAILLYMCIYMYIYASYISMRLSRVRTRMCIHACMYVRRLWIVRTRHTRKYVAHCNHICTRTVRARACACPRGDRCVARTHLRLGTRAPSHTTFLSRTIDPPMGQPVSWGKLQFVLKRSVVFQNFNSQWWKKTLKQNLDFCVQIEYARTFDKEK